MLNIVLNLLSLELFTSSILGAKILDQDMNYERPRLILYIHVHNEGKIEFDLFWFYL